jgi:putative transposase
MPRQPRYRIPGFPQHVVQRGNDRQATFFAPADYVLYKQHLLHAARAHDCAIHAYVLMTNHVHLLVTPGREDSIPRLMQALGRRYVRHVNQAYDRTGTLWEGRYKACLVQADRHFLACQRYIELNPVRAGMVGDPGGYRYSSYRHNALGEADSLITVHATYADLGRDQLTRCANYRAMVEAGIGPAAIDTIRRVTESCRVLGNDRFRGDIEAVLGRSVHPGTPGRPRKNRSLTPI